jgi:hypothetical protein
MGENETLKDVYNCFARSKVHSAPLSLSVFLFLYMTKKGELLFGCFLKFISFFC